MERVRGESVRGERRVRGESEGRLHCPLYTSSSHGFSSTPFFPLTQLSSYFPSFLFVFLLPSLFSPFLLLSLFLSPSLPFPQFFLFPLFLFVYCLSLNHPFSPHAYLYTLFASLSFSFPQILLFPLILIYILFPSFYFPFLFHILIRMSSSSSPHSLSPRLFLFLHCIPLPSLVASLEYCLIPFPSHLSTWIHSPRYLL